MFTWNKFGTSVFDLTITPFSSLRNVRMPTLRTSFIAWKADRITSSAFFSVFCSFYFESSSFCLISSTLYSISFNFVFVLVWGDYSNFSIFKSGSDLPIEFLPWYTWFVDCALPFVDSISTTDFIFWTVSFLIKDDLRCGSVLRDYPKSVPD